MKVRWLVVLLLALGVGAAAVWGWQQWRESVLRSPFAIDNSTTEGLHEVWHARTTLDGHRGLAVLPAVVLVGQADEAVAVDPATGGERWRSAVGSTPVVQGARSVEGTGLIALGAFAEDLGPATGDGILLDTATGAIEERLAVGERTYLGATADGLLWASLVEDGDCAPVFVRSTDIQGRPDWSVEPLLFTSGAGRARLVEGRVFLGMGPIGSSDLGDDFPSSAVLDAASGRVIAQGCAVGSGTGFSPMEGDRILRLDDQWSMKTFRTTGLDGDGRELWHHDGPALAVDGMVFAQTRQGGSDLRLTTQRLDAATGAPLWPEAVEGGRVRVVGDSVVLLRQVPDLAGSLRVVDADTGQVRFARDTPFTVGDVVVADGIVYAWQQLDFDDELPKSMRVIGWDLATGEERVRATLSRASELATSGGVLVAVDHIGGTVHGLAVR